jgi:hypothetical protein
MYLAQEDRRRLPRRLLVAREELDVVSVSAEGSANPRTPDSVPK